MSDKTPSSTKFFLKKYEEERNWVGEKARQDTELKCDIGIIVGWYRRT